MTIYVATSMGVLLLLLALLQAVSSIDFTKEELSSKEATLKLYKRWSAKYLEGRGCNLDNSKRFEIFKSRVREIEDMNQGVVHNRRHLNEFSDVTEDEFNESYTSCYTKSGLIGGFRRLPAFNQTALSAGCCVTACGGGRYQMVVEEL